jgi:hypothetical protein
MTNSNNKQAVAVKTQVNAGGGVHGALTGNHNETVAVKTRVNAGPGPIGPVVGHGTN